MLRIKITCQGAKGAFLETSICFIEEKFTSVIYFYRADANPWETQNQLQIFTPDKDIWTSEKE